LRYLLWIAALLSPRPASLLIDAISRPSDRAGQRGRAELTAIELTKDFGETRIRGREPLDGPVWSWPKR
jgi:hypothetical protein